MRIALLSDIHANATALQAVVEDMAARGVEAVWVLGDILGYGPDAVEVVATLKELEETYQQQMRFIAGNHDVYFLKCEVPGDLSYTVERALMLNRLDLERFPALVAWYRQHLWHEERGCQSVKAWQEGDKFVVLSHGALRCPPAGKPAPASDRLYPVYWQAEFLDHLYHPLHRCAGASEAKRWIVLTGHTHIPSVVSVREEGDFATREERLLAYAQPLPLFDADTKAAIINPGSVGQPRDGDTRASYAILNWETEEISVYRVSYDMASVVERMKQTGYPEQAIQRLREARILHRNAMLTTPRGRRYNSLLTRRRTTG